MDGRTTAGEDSIAKANKASGRCRYPEEQNKTRPSFKKCGPMEGWIA